MADWSFLPPDERAKYEAQDKVQWIVNDNAELGVLVNGVAYFLYKGESLIYEDAAHDDGRPMSYRPVFKREFGECCHPINYKNPEYIGTVSLDDSDEWQSLPRFNSELVK